MVKILLGGSPCTKWSIAKNRGGREVKAEGEGWELFRNYVIAKEKFQPDYFIYENNQSASEEIKEQIKKELGGTFQNIDSALVSAQGRKRFYVHNIDGVEIPRDRHILLNDLIPGAVGAAKRNQVTRNGTLPFLNIRKDGKANAIIAFHQKNNCGCIVNGEYRPLTVEELEALQTLPIGYTKAVCESQRRRQLGNGWTAQVIIHILSYLKVRKDENVVVLSLYDGIGTGRFCLDRLGYKNITYYAYEIDKAAITVARDHYPDIIECGDAFKVRENAWTVPLESAALAGEEEGN